jgi:hypothetical protein
LMKEAARDSSEIGSTTVTIDRVNFASTILSFNKLFPPYRRV